MGLGVITYTILFFYFKNNITIADIDKKSEKILLRGKAVIGRLEDFPVDEYEGKFSLIHFNGVYGWGIDKKDDMMAAVGVIKKILRPGGFVIFGHNIKNHNPFLMELSYKDYFSDLEEIVDRQLPFINEEFNQVFRVFKK